MAIHIRALALLTCYIAPLLITVAASSSSPSEDSESSSLSLSPIVLPMSQLIIHPLDSNSMLKRAFWDRGTSLHDSPADKRAFWDRGNTFHDSGADKRAFWDRGTALHDSVDKRAYWDRANFHESEKRAYWDRAPERFTDDVSKRAYWDKVANANPEEVSKRAYWDRPEKNNLQVTPGAVVCVEAEIRGDVRIGTRSVVHPCAKILATNGPIIMGECNVVEELVIIENKSTEPLVIGKNNTFEVGAQVYASVVGDSNVFETKCFVGEKVAVSSGCVFGAATTYTIPSDVPENSVFYGEPLQHRIAAERPGLQSMQIDFLTRILPNYHHIKNPSKP